MSKSNYAETRTLEYLLRSGTVYLALLTAAADLESPSVTEVTGGGYARQPVTFAPAVAGNPSSCTSSADVVFPTATTDWGTVAEWAVMDSLVGGNILYDGTLAASRSIPTGYAATAAAGSIVCTED